MAYDALEVVKLRNNFYRDSYHKVIIALIVSLLAVLGTVTVIVFLMITRPTPKYFASTDSGRVIPLIPLNQPNLGSKAVLQWASEAVISVYSYNFVNFRKSFEGSRKYFTDVGWRSYMTALEQSKNLETVQKEKLVVSAVLTGAPIVTNQSEVGGRYTWWVQMPVLVTYQSLNKHIPQSFIIKLVIRRISTLDNIYGVGIVNFIAARRTAATG